MSHNFSFLMCMPFPFCLAQPFLCLLPLPPAVGTLLFVLLPVMVDEKQRKEGEQPPGGLQKAFKAVQVSQNAVFIFRCLIIFSLSHTLCLMEPQALGALALCSRPCALQQRIIFSLSHTVCDGASGLGRASSLQAMCTLQQRIANRLLGTDWLHRWCWCHAGWM